MATTKELSEAGVTRIVAAGGELPAPPCSAREAIASLESIGCARKIGGLWMRTVVVTMHADRAEQMKNEAAIVKVTW